MYVVKGSIYLVISSEFDKIIIKLFACLVVDFRFLFFSSLLKMQFYFYK